MYKRIIELIVEFSYHAEWTVKELAAKYQVSIQTIRNDINAINEILTEHHYEKIRVIKGHIVCPENFIEIKRFVNLKAAESNLYSYHLSKEELCTVTSVILIFAERYTTINQLVELLSISRTTFINRSTFLREYTQQLGLKMLASSNKGLVLKNTETEKRNALIKLIRQTIKENEFLLNLILKSDIVTKQDNRKITKSILYKAQQKFGLSLSDESFIFLNYYLSFALERIRTGNYIDAPAGEGTAFFYCAEKIMSEISTVCNIPLVETETRFLSCVLENLIHPSGVTELSRNMMEIQLLTAILIENVSDCLRLDLKQDYQLLEMLSSHLISIYKNSAVDVDNPVLNDIRNTQTSVISAVKANIEPIENYFHRVLSEVEIIYITIHFSAAIERYRSNHYVYRVIVACNAGIGTSQLIKAKLSCFTNIHVMRTVSSWEISSLTKADADLLISAVPIYQSPIEFINISGNITNQDLMRISKKIRDMYNAGIKPAENILEDNTIDRIIEAVQPIIHEFAAEKEKEVFKKIKEAICHAANCTPPAILEKTAAPYLYELLAPEFIQLDVSCRDWKEAIYQSSAILAKRQYFNDKYVEEIIDITEKYGAYYMFAKGIALLHAAPGKNSHKIGITLTRLAPPVLFDTPQGKQPISYTIFLSVVDKKEHLRALFSLIRLMKEPEFIQQLNATQTPEEVYHLIYISERNIKTNKGDF